MNKSLFDYTGVYKCISLNVCMHVNTLVRVQCFVQTDRQKSQAGRKMCSLKISVLF